MKTRICGVLLLLGIMTAGVATWVIAEEGAIPLGPTTETTRYEFLPHKYTVGGFEQEVFIRLDMTTGRTWRFHASNPRWSAIPESEDGAVPQEGQIVRYELFPHHYLDQNGDQQELMLRVDSVTGTTWSYRGASGSWNEVPLDD